MQDRPLVRRFRLCMGSLPAVNPALFRGQTPPKLRSKAVISNRITCITKPHPHSPREHITHVGGARAGNLGISPANKLRTRSTAETITSMSLSASTTCPSGPIPCTALSTSGLPQMTRRETIFSVSISAR